MNLRRTAEGQERTRGGKGEVQTAGTTGGDQPDLLEKVYGGRAWAPGQYVQRMPAAP